ncbi:GNAT family N-acetyltransferase [Lacticaseibacillus mingshuiensis]|uniref:GNAT family N-acetyltransferase n=1 Tax=Lacticaseibacillus mingshuiensis TaxID=2799574 RepID=UPI001943E9E8|nr:GNAT family N-acetyltransferase [Lacticaseibacillus mingshuiensis]
MTEITIKETAALTPAELLTIMAARVRVFVVEQNCPYQEVDDKDYQAVHVMLRENGALVAYGRLVPHDDGKAISFGRVLVVRSARGRGLARELVATLLSELATRYPSRPVKIQAQAYLQAFYGSFGFRAVSDVYLEDGIPHVDMVLDKTAAAR